MSETPGENIPDPGTQSLLDGLKFGDADNIGADEGPAPRRQRKIYGTGRSNAKARNEPKPKVTVPAYKKDEFVQPLTELYTTVGTLIFIADQHVGQTVIQQAPACADSLDQLAAKNPEVRKALRQLTQVGAMGAVIAAHAPIAMAAFVSVNQRRSAQSTATSQEDTNNEQRIRPPTATTTNESTTTNGPTTNAATDSQPTYSFPGHPGNNDEGSTLD